MGSWNTVVVNGYAAIKEAAEKQDDSFSSRPAFTTQRLFQECNGDVSISLGQFDSAYLAHRKVAETVLRHFTGKHSAFTEELLNEEVDLFSSLLLNKTKCGPVDIRDDIQHAVGSFLYQLLYGRGEDVSEKLEEMIEFSEAFIKFAENGNYFDAMPWLLYFKPKPMVLFKKLLTDNACSIKVKIDEHFKTFSKEGQPRCIIDRFLATDIEDIKSQTGLTRSRLLRTVTDLQAAGFETSNKSLQFLILHMCKYPDTQLKVQREIDDAIGGNEKVTLKDRGHLVCTEAIILESMRMASISPFGLPKSTRHDSQLQGFDINKGTVVYFNLHSAAYDKEFWVDPETFRPERFINENNQLDLKICCRVIPFSIGRRRCVGEHLAKMEMFMLFANIMQKMSFLEPEGETVDLESVPGLVYSPKPFRVLIKERI